jgi:hypothetical protein
MVQPNHACSSSLCLPGICTGLLRQIDTSNPLIIVLVQRLSSYRHVLPCCGWSSHSSVFAFYLSRFHISRMSLLCCLSSRLRRRYIVVVLLCKQVSLDLAAILQQLEVALYKAFVSHFALHHSRYSEPDMLPPFSKRNSKETPDMARY